MDWRFSLFLLSLFVLLIAFTWGTSEEGLCSSAYVKGVLTDHTKDGALNCFEFWFNRYQTSIGAIATIFAGYLAFRGAAGQIKEVQKQIPLLAIQSSAVTAVELRAMIAKCKKINELIPSLAEQDSRGVAVRSGL